MNDFMVQDVSFFFVTDDAEIIYVSDYDSRLNSSVVFIMMTNDILNSDYGENNSICISMDYLSGKQDGMKTVFDYQQELPKMQERIKDFRNNKHDIKFIWQADYNEIPNVKYITRMERLNDFDGYLNTKNVISNAYNMFTEHNENTKLDPDNHPLQYVFGKLTHIEQMFPAAFAAYESIVTIKDKTYHGFVPSQGQVGVIFDKRRDINAILKTYVSKKIQLKDFHYLDVHTSSQFNYRYVYPLMKEGQYYGEKTYDIRFVIPVYTL